MKIKFYPGDDIALNSSILWAFSPPLFDGLHCHPKPPKTLDDRWHYEFTQTGKTTDENCQAEIQQLYPGLYMTTGAAPVQIEGTLPDGNWLYFRSRWHRWSVTIARVEDDIFNDKRLYYCDAVYGSDSDASWMPHSEAWAIVHQNAKEWLERNG